MDVQYNSEKKIVCEILQNSFINNKSVDYVLKGGLKVTEQRNHLIEYSYSFCKRFGQVYIEDNACALVIFPEKIHKRLFDYYHDLKFIFKSVGLKKLSLLLKREKIIKGKRGKNENSLYIWFIGVNTKFQGKGIGSSLLQRIIKEYPNKTIYLETSSKRNLSFYSRNGFLQYNQHSFSYLLYFLRKN